MTILCEPGTINRWFLRLAWLISGGLAVYLPILLARPQSALVQHENHDGVVYVGNSVWHPETVLSVFPAGRFTRLDLRVAFILGCLPTYANIFQTADGNTGFRLEACPDGTL